MSDQENKGVEAEGMGEAIVPLIVAEEGGRGHVLDPASNTIAGVLSGGYVDPGSGEIYRNFVLREFGGAVEKILASKGYWTILLHQALAESIVSLGPISDRMRLRAILLELPEVDIAQLIIAARRVSLGDTLFINNKCPNEECREKNEFQFDLRHVEIYPMPDPQQRRFTHTLTSGRVVTWHVLRGKDHEWSVTIPSRVREKEKMNILHLARVEKVGETALCRENGNIEGTIAELNRLLKFRDREELRMIIDECEGGIDKDIEFECKHCKQEWSEELPLGERSFFFPSATRRRSRKR